MRSLVFLVTVKPVYNYGVSARPYIVTDSHGSEFLDILKSSFLYPQSDLFSLDILMIDVVILVLCLI